ncbi:MAG TPA: IS21 family transposase [Gammaproteobacteria bacterium]|nr:IS21 family transposase [Gammaproteobacteria bacterium]
MVMLAKIRRMHFRDGLSVREVARRTGLSRNTIRRWLRSGQSEPVYPKRSTPTRLDPYREQLERWLRTDSHRPRRERRTAKTLFAQLQACGYPGSYTRVTAFIREWKERGGDTVRPAFVPLLFPPGEAFQFDWSCEYAVIGGQRVRLDVAHLKLACSRAFWLVAYPMQSHEMLFDAHTRAFQALGGVPRRGIYDNMKTAVDRVGRSRERAINARFQALCSHYLFAPEFCNRAAGWEKGIVEKNVQDRRRQLWVEAGHRHWPDLASLNDWLAAECRAAWAAMPHPQAPGITIAETLADEQPHLMPLPAAFDGYVEVPVRVSATALVHFQRNRYSVPCEHAHTVASLRVYPFELVVVLGEAVIARHPRCFERDRTCYDWQHYISAVQRKPGALRDGAPFLEMPEPLRRLRALLLRQPDGDRAMARVLATVPQHGLDAVLVAVELVLESGPVNGEHVLNVLARLQHPERVNPTIASARRLQEPPRPDMARYDALRQEGRHVDA